MKHYNLKRDFYCSLIVEDITDRDHNHVESVWEEFGIKNIGEYRDLYIQSDILLLVDIFENFRNKYRKIYFVDPINILSAPRL